MAARTSEHLPVLDAHKTRCGPVRGSRRGVYRAAVLVLVHLAVFLHVAHWKIAGKTLTPMEPSEAMQTLEMGYVNAGFVLFLILILTTMVLGRFFCGWACHVVAYQDLCQWILKKAGVRPRPIRSRLLVLVPFGAAFYMFLWPQVLRLFEGRSFPLLTAHFTTTSFWETFPGPAVAVVTLLVDGFLIVYLLGGKAFCTYGCPYGAVFGVTDRLALGKIRVNDDCEQCGHCTATCTSNVRVHEEVAKYKMVVDTGCMKCMDCVNVCPKSALSFKIGRPAFLGKRPKVKRKRIYDFSWGEEILMAVVFLGALYAFRGLYGLVPFLLAVGMSVLTAVAGLVGWRLIRRADLVFQYRTLKRAGRLEPWGAGVVAGFLVLSLFVLHSGWIQENAREAERFLLEAEELPPEERGDLMAASLGRLMRAESYGLFSVGTQQLKIGSILREQGDLRGAEEWMRKAIATDGALRTPRLELAGLLIMRGEYREAEDVLGRLLDLDPQNARAREWLEGVRARAAD